MDITDYLAVGILASQAVIGAGIAYGIAVVRRCIAKLPQDAIDGPHQHRFDTMVGDGAGWRCGVCGEPKTKEES